MKTINYILLIAVSVIIFPVNFKPIFAASCTAAKPDAAPDLFQIDATKTSAKLYFTPVNNAVTNYTIIYGLERLRNDFVVSFPFGPHDGVIDFTINDLNPNTKYYFRVRADNGCRQGWWSDTLSAETNFNFKTYTKVKVKEKPPELKLNYPSFTQRPVISDEAIKEPVATPSNYPAVSPVIVNYQPNSANKPFFQALIASIISKITAFFN